MSQPGPAATSGNLTLPHMPGRILGIDAGGSGTRVILLQNGTVTARPDGPPMNALLTDGFAGHLRQIIEAADATAAGIGMPGVRQANQARAQLFDLQGRLVRTLLDVAVLEAGMHEVFFDGKSSRGQPVSSGVLFYRLTSTEGTFEGRIVVLK